MAKADILAQQRHRPAKIEVLRHKSDPSDIKACNHCICIIQVNVLKFQRFDHSIIALLHLRSEPASGNLPEQITSDLDGRQYQPITNKKTLALRARVQDEK
jgi:hypothetical protein